MLMRGLARCGVENLLLAPPGPLLERARGAGLATVSWHARGDWDVPALVAASNAMRQRAPEVAHAHTARAHALGVPAARLAHVPAVVVSRRVAVPIRGGLGGLKYRMPVDRYLCVSRAVVEAMKAGGVPAARLALVPSGIEPESPPGPPLRGLLGLPAAALLVGTAAALTPEKCHRDLLAAMTQIREAVPEVHMVWVGDGSLRRELEADRLRRGLESRVHLLVFRDDARALMAQCTIVALASQLEGIGTTLIEAQADGVPVVATGVGGVPEVVQDGVTGHLVPARDPAALAAALVELLTHPERRTAMGAAAQIAAREFHIDRTVEATLNAYRVVLSGGRQTA